MANPKWSTLSVPQSPLLDGYSETWPELLIRTEMEVGPAKVRQRLSYNVTPLTLVYSMSATQVGTFKSWWSTTIMGGSVAYDLVHPRDGSTVVVRMTGPPKVSRISGSTAYRVEFGVEIMP